MQSTISLSPSFTTTHSSAALADIAARVVQELRLDSQFDDDVFHDDVAHQNPSVQGGKEEEVDNSDFEFPSVCKDPPQSISADEIFYNGQIRPVFPIFGRKDLLFRDGRVINYSSEARNQSTVRSSLRALMREERDPPSCSSSESDDLDGVPTEIYCAWTPKSAAAAEVKKSGSTGSSKRWRIRDLLFRSNSDGRRESFVFVASSNGKRKDDKGFKKETKMEKSSFGGGEVVPVTAVQEEDDYGKNGVAAGAVVEDGERRQSYGRQDWVGFFANVNGAGSLHHPF